MGWAMYSTHICRYKPVMWIRICCVADLDTGIIKQAGKKLFKVCKWKIGRYRINCEMKKNLGLKFFFFKFKCLALFLAKFRRFLPPASGFFLRIRIQKVSHDAEPGLNCQLAAAIVKNILKNNCYFVVNGNGIELKVIYCSC